MSLADWQPDGGVDLADVVGVLNFLFRGGPAHPLAVPGQETSGCVLMEGFEASKGCE